MIWDTPPRTTDVYITDVPDLGRYMIKRQPRWDLDFRLYLNGQPTSYFGTVEQLKSIVARIAASRILGSKL